MITHPGNFRIFLATEPVDFRKVWTDWQQLSPIALKWIPFVAQYTFSVPVALVGLSLSFGTALALC